MSFSLFTYNTLFNKATLKIESVLSRYRPDIICLQEIDTSMNNLAAIEKYGYKLADYANSFIKSGHFFGVATYYNPKKLRFIRSDIFYLGVSFVEILFTLIQVVLGYKKPKSFLKTDFKDIKSGKTVTVCNLHLYVVGSNALRIAHIKQALERINNSNPLIIAGDFNYLPYQRKKLETFMKKNDLLEATSGISQTIKFTPDGEYENFNLFQKMSLKLAGHALDQIKIDYVFYRRLKLVSSRRINIRYSDHYPIVVKYSF